MSLEEEYNQETMRFLKDLGRAVNCLRCDKYIQRQYWIAEWMRQKGSLCGPCQKFFNKQGNKAMEEAEAEIENLGVFQVLQTKEKFGEWRIYCTVTDMKEYEKLDLKKDPFNWLRALEEKYTELYPGFTFYFG